MPAICRVKRACFGSRLARCVLDYHRVGVLIVVIRTKTAMDPEKKVSPYNIPGIHNNVWALTSM